MSVSPCNRGIDYSGYRPDPTGVKKDGASFIFRYSAGVGNNDPKAQWKLCGTAEIRQAVNADLDFIANSEWYSTRITEGAAAGAADGAQDLAFWKSRGLNTGATIYVSYDTQPVYSKFDDVEAYLKAYKKALQGVYDVGLYGGTPVLKAMIARGAVTKTWRTNAGSWSNDGLPYQPSTRTYAQRQKLVDQGLLATPANIWQTGNYWYGKNADENLVLRSPVGSHLEQATVPSAPHPTPPPPHPAPVPVPAPGPYYGGPEKDRILDNSKHFAVVLTSKGVLELHEDGKSIGTFPSTPKGN